MKTTWLVTTMVAIALASSPATAEEKAVEEEPDETSFGFAFTIGEGMYFIDDDVYRGPVSLEVVPWFGWPWFKIDLGLSTTLESIEIAGTNVGHWNFTFRPGGRVTPTMIPLYFRFAFPLQLQRDNFDWGLMLGLGAEIRIIPLLGIVLEVDTTLNNDLAWGGDGIPLEFRLGVNFHFGEGDGL
jgi:hypothetical protein